MLNQSTLFLLNHLGCSTWCGSSQQLKAHQQKHQQVVFSTPLRSSTIPYSQQVRVDKFNITWCHHPLNTNLLFNSAISYFTRVYAMPFIRSRIRFLTWVYIRSLVLSWFIHRGACLECPQSLYSFIISHQSFTSKSAFLRILPNTDVLPCLLLVLVYFRHLDDYFLIRWLPIRKIWILVEPMKSSASFLAVAAVVHSIPDLERRCSALPYRVPAEIFGCVVVTTYWYEIFRGRCSSGCRVKSIYWACTNHPHHMEEFISGRRAWSTDAQHSSNSPWGVRKECSRTCNLLLHKVSGCRSETGLWERHTKCAGKSPRKPFASDVASIPRILGCSKPRSGEHIVWKTFVRRSCTSVINNCWLIVPLPVVRRENRARSTKQRHEIRNL